MPVHSSAGGSFNARLSKDLQNLMVQEIKLNAQLRRGFRLLTALALIRVILAWTMGHWTLALKDAGLYVVLAFVYWRISILHRGVLTARYAAEELLNFEEVFELNKAESDQFARLLYTLDGALNFIERGTWALSWRPKQQDLVRRTLIACDDVLKVLDRDPKFSVRIRSYPLLTRRIENE